MARLEDLTRGALVRGILPGSTVTVVDVTWHGSTALELVYKDSLGRAGTELVFRDREPSLELVAPGRAWTFGADGALVRLVSEALRIRLAHLFDPLLAVHTSLIEPLPHQITAVYGEMLPRQPLRSLLAACPWAAFNLDLNWASLHGNLDRLLAVGIDRLANVHVHGRVEASRLVPRHGHLEAAVRRLLREGFRGPYTVELPDPRGPGDFAAARRWLASILGGAG